MLQSFLTVGQQILTLYLLLVVGFVLSHVTKKHDTKPKKHAEKNK